jgi:hypothetical protein
MVLLYEWKMLLMTKKSDLLDFERKEDNKVMWIREEQG